MWGNNHSVKEDEARGPPDGWGASGASEAGDDAVG